MKTAGRQGEQQMWFAHKQDSINDRKRVKTFSMILSVGNGKAQLRGQYTTC